MADGCVQIEHAAAVPDQRVAVLSHQIAVITLGAEIRQDFAFSFAIGTQVVVEHAPGVGQEFVFETCDGLARQQVFLVGVFDLGDDDALERLRFDARLLDIGLRAADNAP